MTSEKEGLNLPEPHVAWIYTEPIFETLDAATWLQTTDALRKAGWKVTLAAPGPGGKREAGGVEVLCISRPDIYLLRQFIFHLKVVLFLLLHWNRVDVILFHSMSAPFLLPLRLLRVLCPSGRPLLVLDTRTVQMEPIEMETPRVRVREAFHRFSRRMADMWADGQTAITERMAKAVGIPNRKLWGVWPSGVDPGQFLGAREARKWPGEGDSVHLVYIGALHHERNLRTLAQAVQQANQEGLSLRLSLIGDGTERSDLERFAAHSEGFVQVLPPVPHDKVGDVLAKAHIGVSPFRNEEKFRVSSPIKLFEYMASGLPLLATRIACHTDVVGDGSYAIWAESGDLEGLLDALRLAWRLKDRLPLMGREAAKAAEFWTWEQSAKKLRRALELGLRGDR
jgi:glycosyltransferase involved in cell wall biosynthesis